MMKRLVTCLLALTMLLLAGCQNTGNSSENSTNNNAANDGEVDIPAVDGIQIHLSDNAITVDGEAIGADTAAPVYAARDIVFYLEGQDLTYGEGAGADAHSQSEADAHTVVHITHPGTYILSGKLSAGQIAVDLGEGAEEDPAAVATLVLNGVDLTCTVAPAVIFYNVYECGEKDTETAGKDVDTSAAGANVIIADGSVNYVNGSYVARIYKPGSVELSEDGAEVVDSKKLHKYDGAFYSKMSMNVDGGEIGDGNLNISAENEGLDSELHLTINGGNIYIQSGNDGINTNEDGVSVTTINGGCLGITVTGATGEGDGIDSNGWLVINGGTIIAQACSTSGDAGIDSDMGIYLNGGTVAAYGNMLDHIAGGDANYVVFQFAQRQTDNVENKTSYTLKNESGYEYRVLPSNDFTYWLISNEELVPGEYTLWKDDVQLAGVASSAMGGMVSPGGFDEEQPGMTPPEGMELPPDGFGGPMQPNEDGTVTLPDGTVVDQSPMSQGGKKPDEGMMEPPTDGGTPPEGGAQPGQRPMGGNTGMAGGESRLEFRIMQGGNYFSAVAPAQAK